MSYQIIATPSAQKDLSKLPKKMQQQIAAHVDDLAGNPRPRHSIKMAGPSGDYRLKIGKYRVVYAIDDAKQQVVVRVIRHRKDVYR